MSKGQSEVMAMPVRALHPLIICFHLYLIIIIISICSWQLDAEIKVYCDFFFLIQIDLKLNNFMNKINMFLASLSWDISLPFLSESQKAFSTLKPGSCALGLIVPQEPLIVSEFQLSADL